MKAQSFDTTRLTLGEGPLWLATQQAFCWFDIIEGRMYRRGLDQDAAQVWQFPEMVSAAAETTEPGKLIIASQTALLLADAQDPLRNVTLIELEADNPVTRSNDGRADPQGGFWIGTMGIGLERGAGAIYRFFKGELRQLYPGITVPNAICFAPDGKTAYFTDTITKQVMRQALDRDGWPDGAPEVFLNLTTQGLNPDGAVIDARGHMLLACWGAHAVLEFNPEGREVQRFTAPASQISCPALGARDLKTMIATSASEGDGASDPQSGQTFLWPLSHPGQANHKVLL